MSELKPCPFCETSLEFFGHDIRNGKKVEVHRHPTPENPTWDECPLSGLIFDVERWNKRSLEDALQQKYDILLLKIKKVAEKIQEEDTKAVALYRERDSAGFSTAYVDGLIGGLEIATKIINELLEEK